MKCADGITGQRAATLIGGVDCSGGKSLMCIVCNPAFAGAFRDLSYKSRRQFLRAAGAATAGPFVAELIGSGAALADGAVNSTLQQGLTVPAAAATIFVASKIITMERENPTATAVAVEGNKIVAAGSLEQVKAALADRRYAIDTTFAAKILMPGFIDQHLHPVLGALTLAIEVIAIEDWVLPSKTHKAASTPAEYQARLKAAEARLAGPSEWLMTWGYHALWHGKLTRDSLDALSVTRPIAVWHRSCHEFILNTPALAALGLTEEMIKRKKQWS
jgi:hypothetical protein